MPNRTVATVLGALTGAVGLVAMLRLVSGAFGGRSSGFAWATVLVAMVPWVVYVGWRARRGSGRTAAALAVAGLDAAGLVLVWLVPVGTVLALALSLAAFAVIWAHDRPVGSPRGEDRFVRLEEMKSPDPE